MMLRFRIVQAAKDDPPRSAERDGLMTSRGRARQEIVTKQSHRGGPPVFPGRMTRGTGAGWGFTAVPAREDFSLGAVTERAGRSSRRHSQATTT